MVTLPETNSSPLKMDPGKGDSYCKPPFLGAMLVFGSVIVGLGPGGLGF